MLIAKRTSLLQVILVWYDNTCLTLDGLDEESSKVGAGDLKCLAQGSLIIVCDGLFGSWNCASDTGQIRTIVLARLGVGR